MLGGPHEAAGNVLGVEVAAVARGHVDRGDRQRRVDPVHAHAVVLRGDRAGHVRAVRRVIPAPRRRVLVGDAVDVAGHGLRVVDLTGQIRHGVVDGLVHDAHRHGRAHDVHVLGFQGSQRLEVPPVGGLRVGRHPGLVLALSAAELSVARLRAARLRGVGLRSGLDRLVRGHAGRIVDGDHGLVTADGRLAGRANRVVADALLDQRLSQVGRERRGSRLDEERSELRVARQD